MTDVQKTRLEALRGKSESELTDSEKTELGLLVTIEKQDKQITEKDSVIGKRATEIDNLKKEIESATGKEKTALEQRLAEKEESISTLKEGLAALKEAKETNSSIAGKLSQEKPGHGDAVDPKELEELERKAFEDEEAKAAIEDLYKNMDGDDKKAYRTDPVFRKGIFERVLGTEGDETDDSPWGSAVKKKEGTPQKTAQERLEELFNGTKEKHRNLPPMSSGRGGRGRVKPTNMPKPADRAVDDRTK